MCYLCAFVDSQNSEFLLNEFVFIMEQVLKLLHQFCRSDVRNRGYFMGSMDSLLCVICFGGQRDIASPK